MEEVVKHPALLTQFADLSSQSEDVCWTSTSCFVTCTCNEMRPGALHLQQRKRKAISRKNKSDSNLVLCMCLCVRTRE